MRASLCLVLALTLVSGAALPAQQAVPTTVDPATIAAAEAIVDLLVKRDFTAVAARFNATMKAALPVEKLGAAWDSISTQAGAFQKRAGARSERKGDYSVVAITSDFERVRVELLLTFDKAGEVAGFMARPATANIPYVPPDYAPVSSSTEREVVVGDWSLPGTLTLPAGAGPFPGVVLLHGSGPNDRDESFGPNRIFKDLALGLAARGVAVLRYEKRTKQHPAKASALPNFTVKEEAIDDALAALALLRGESAIDPRRVYLVGHSLGAMIAPRIGVADARIAGLVLLAAPARPITTAIVEQLQYLADADGVVTDAEQKGLEDARALMAAVGRLTGTDAANAATMGGAPASYWLDLRDYDPVGHAAKLTLPMLILQGGRDYQVTIAADFQKWRSALDGRPNVTLKSYASLNHMFIAGEGPSLPAEYMRPGHVAIEVVTDIANWINK